MVRAITYGAEYRKLQIIEMLLFEVCSRCEFSARSVKASSSYIPLYLGVITLHYLSCGEHRRGSQSISWSFAVFQMFSSRVLPQLLFQPRFSSKYRYLVQLECARFSTSARLSDRCVRLVLCFFFSFLL